MRIKKQKFSTCVTTEQDLLPRRKANIKNNGFSVEEFI